MCQTRDLGIQWPHWHTLFFSDETRIDVRFFFPRDVKKMLVQRARSENWKKWAAEHEYEELKERVWLEPGLALLRKKVRGERTVKLRNVARKIFLEGGWTQTRLFDICWSDASQCQVCHTEEGTEKHRFCHCSEWHESRREILEAFRKWEQKARTSKEEWKWQRGIVTHPPSESQRKRSCFSMTKWWSEKHRSWVCQQEASRATWLPTAPC